MNRLDPFEEGDDSDGGEAPRDHSTTPAPPPPPPSSSLPQSASTTIAKVIHNIILHVCITPTVCV